MGMKVGSMGMKLTASDGPEGAHPRNAHGHFAEYEIPPPAQGWGDHGGETKKHASEKQGCSTGRPNQQRSRTRLVGGQEGGEGVVLLQ